MKPVTRKDLGGNKLIMEVADEVDRCRELGLTSEGSALEILRRIDEVSNECKRAR